MVASALLCLIGLATQSLSDLPITDDLEKSDLLEEHRSEHFNIFLENIEPIPIFEDYFYAETPSWTVTIKREYGNVITTTPEDELYETMTIGNDLKYQGGRVLKNLNKYEKEVVIDARHGRRRKGRPRKFSGNKKRRQRRRQVEPLWRTLAKQKFFGAALWFVLV